MRALVENNPEYKAVKLIRADWDTHSSSALTKELEVRRRSTLVMFKDGVEISRVLGQTNKAVIEDMFKAAVS